MTGKKKIGLVTLPFGKASLIPVSNMIKIISEISDEIFLITGGEGSSIHKDGKLKEVYVIESQADSVKGFRIFRGIISRLKITLAVGYLSRKINTWIFPMGADSLLPAILAAKMMGTPVIINLPSSPQEIIGEGPKWLKNILLRCTKINFLISDRIIVYSPRLITEWKLESYQNKILVAHEHFLDFNTFTITKPLHERPPLIGYIGRLSPEKGVQHFVQALPAILRDKTDLRVFIGGEGPLTESIELSLQTEKLSARVDIPGWVSREDLPKILNRVQLLIIPSYTEGLPNIMLEAMACGTPVLATSVGAISDVIRDGETGFIMGNNSPECIGKNVIMALNYPDLEKIAINGRLFVYENYSFEKSVESWRMILENGNMNRL